MVHVISYLSRWSFIAFAGHIFGCTPALPLLCPDHVLHAVQSHGQQHGRPDNGRNSRANVLMMVVDRDWWWWWWWWRRRRRRRTMNKHDREMPTYDYDPMTPTDPAASRPTLHQVLTTPKAMCHLGEIDPWSKYRARRLFGRSGSGNGANRWLAIRRNLPSGTLVRLDTHHI